MPDRHARRSPAWPSPARQPAARRVRRRALLRGLRARPASGSWSAAAATLPNPSLVKTFRAGAATPVDIQFGPGGDLFYADVWDGQIKRIRYTAGNQAPRAVASATPHERATRRSPVTFDAPRLERPRRRRAHLRMGPGRRRGLRRLEQRQPDVRPTRAAASTRWASRHRQPRRDGHRLRGHHRREHAARRHDQHPSPAASRGTSATRSTSRAAPPTRRSSASARTSSAGRSCSTTAPRPATRTSCQSFPGNDWGDFDAPGPRVPVLPRADSSRPPTAADSPTPQSVRLDPKTVDLSLRSTPSGLQLTVNGQTRTTPFDVTVIQDSANTLSAPTPQTLASATYDFGSWSDGGLRAHDIVATSEPHLHRDLQPPLGRSRRA